MTDDVKNSGRKSWKQEVRSVVLLILAVFVFRSVVADHYVVPSGSMLPNILIGDHLLVNKMAFSVRVPFTDVTLIPTGEPHRGDIIVFKNPRDPSVIFVKRLIGLPGDTLEIQDGFVKVNGEALEKSTGERAAIMKDLSEGGQYFEAFGDKRFTVQRYPHSSFSTDSMKVTVPPDSFFFMGDNRDDSADSRVWGFAPRRYLKGRVWGVLFSFDRDGRVPTPRVSRFGKSLS